MMLMDQLELVEIAYKLTTRQFDGKKAPDTQGDILTRISLNNYLFNPNYKRTRKAVIVKIVSPKKCVFLTFPIGF